MEGKIIVRGVALGLGALILATLIAFFWVWLASVAFDPGHDAAFYQAYGQRVAPVAGLIAGLPLLFAAGWLAARARRPVVAAIVPVISYILLDLALMAAGNLWASPLALILSYVSKLLAAWAGGRMAVRRSARPRLR